MLPSIFDLGQNFTNFRSKIFNLDLDANHYLYNVFTENIFIAKLTKVFIKQINK